MKHMDIEQLSLAEKIGQMFACGLHGTEPSQEIIDVIQNYHIGGIIYFRRNIDTAAQVGNLSHGLQKIAKQHSDIPLFISIDQEGGMVARIDREITLSPGNMALGATRDIEGVFEAAIISGKELRTMGINMNFAPCIDINNNPLNPVIGVRSYGENAELVKEMGQAAIRGFQESGVSATVKHFPGHGDTDTDSHLGLPSINHDMQRLEELELVPFQGAIEEGVDAIMTSHVVFPAIESSGVPATLSHHVLTGLLRKKLGYKGLVVTDCLEMSAISEGIGTDEGAVRAVEAGADLILISHTYERQTNAIKALIQAVESGRISEQRIHESVERILHLKNKRNMHQWNEEHLKVDKMIGQEKDWNLARKLSEKSITLVKDQQQLPLKDKKTYVVWTEVRVGTEVDEVIEQADTLGAALSKKMTAVDEDRIGVFPSGKEIQHVLDRSKHYEQVVFVSYNAMFSTGQTKIVNEISQREDVVFLVAATRNPFDYLQFPQVKTYLACYENRPLAMESLANVLLGVNPAQGKLPVSISQEYPYGWSETTHS
jgi:beta-N-acetylhexosaminidase